MLAAFLEQLGLAAALVGVLSGLRGWWPETQGREALVVVCTLVGADGGGASNLELSQRALAEKRQASTSPC